MSDQRITNEDMQRRIVRFEEMKETHGVPLMFIDSILPGHHRMNYAVIGDTASEESEYNPVITEPHKFQIGMVKAPPGSGPAFHTHDYVEAFMPLSGKWRFYWANDPELADNPEGESVLEPWDLISLPPKLWRGFENVSDEDAWIIGILEEHTVFTSKDPYWAPHVIEQAKEHGFEADESGRMVRPDNFEEIRERMRAQLEGTEAGK